MELMELQQDFTPDREAQERGVRLILEEPSQGRIFVLRSDDRIIGMANILFPIPIAVGGLVILMEDIVVSFAEAKNFRRITFLTDKMSPPSQEFFSKPQFEFSHLIPMRRLLA
jgi:hypothetical protein